MSKLKHHLLSRNPVIKSRTNPLLPDRKLECAARSQGYSILAGVDEAGRGPLAGPVVAASCVIPESVRIPGVNDSKKILPAHRQALFEVLTTHPEVFYGVGIISTEEIDRVNILQATILAMRQAVENLLDQPDYLLIDGLQIPEHSIPNEKVIKGDARCFLIAAASILAKVTRDKLMEEYHEQWPEYGFNRHKGYGTRQHREAIDKYGPCPIHRMTFEPLKSVWNREVSDEESMKGALRA